MSILIKRAIQLIFSIIILSCIISCKTIDAVPNAVWKLPKKPVIASVHFSQKDGGLYIDEVSSENLLNNTYNMEKYSEKLEALILEMKKFYGAK